MVTHNVYKKEIDSLKSLLTLKDERISKINKEEIDSSRFKL